MPPIKVGQLGEFLRDQRKNAQLSLRQLAEQAGVSNPYLSQIERGLRKPSAEILQQIAKGLRISAEQLYVQAGILDERTDGELAVESALLADPRSPSARSGCCWRSTARSGPRTPTTPRPGRLVSSTMRSPRRAASRTLCVTKMIVRFVSFHTRSSSSWSRSRRHGVERAERLVHQQHVGVLREGTRQRNTLAHAARKFVRAPCAHSSEVHEFEQFAGTRPSR